MKAVAIVGIKTNNVRLPGKNTRPLARRPLYEHMWSTLKACKRVDRVLVDSSDATILDAARRWGFDIHERDPSLNEPSVSGHDLLNNVLPLVGEDIMIQIFVTTPLLTARSIDGAIEALIDRPDIDSLIPVYPVYDRFWYKGEPVSHNPRSLVGTQYMSPLYREAGFYLFRRAAYEQERARVMKRRATFEVPEAECIDIDQEIDFLYAEAVLQMQQSGKPKGLDR